ncbi:S41 family peptidase [Prolixibacter denitrificans]|uniref:Peptidase S41-like protein n=1 Tax=Prolixibacter denitrificans TaxID=1541063 RepID=A0A2P8C6N6_9BACT|nr:S41 family peptidase [Prolixibacter denitrificans]PSK80587.1 peptidase S41-like protein [Prolixibacter denitrificans]GET22119.1 hypothetical protein JCM18694_23650 [Prolixibacter denitrificans]
MKNILLLSTLFFLLAPAYGQVLVTFRIDIEDLIAAGLLSPADSNKVFVRGSFNNWRGTAHELKRLPEQRIYQGTFDLNKEAGDTISYKFVIEKKQGHFFWERNPDPTNPGNGNRQFTLEKEKMVLPIAHFRYDEYFIYPVVFSKQKLQEDFRQFRQILETTHPALYDYTTKEVLDSLFDLSYSRIDTALDFRTFLMLMTEVISQVGCGHSSLWIPNAYWNVAPERLFPLKLQAAEGKTYVTGSYDNKEEIPIGSELLIINQMPISALINQLAALTSADGFNHSYRLTKATQNFAIKYAHAYGFQDTFQIEYLVPGKRQKQVAFLQPVSKEAVDKSKTKHTELSFKEIEGTNAGVLTINTFGYYSRVGMFRSFVDSVFQVIEKNAIGNLILDLRGNGGGDPFCSSYLWAYLEPEPVPYFEDHYGKYDTLANPVPQPAFPYQGKLFTLIDGNGFSTTGHFCGLLKYHQVGKFIGTEIGATYTCTGNATYPPLKHTRIMVGTARVRRYTAAVKNMDPKRGIIPDYPVELTQQDIIDGRDAVLEYALKLAGATD